MGGERVVLEISLSRLGALRFLWGNAYNDLKLYSIPYRD